MENIHQRFSDKFGSHWIKVKFYREKPECEAKRLKGVRFCEATKEAILYPVLLDKESVICSGAQHAFGWNALSQDMLLQGCGDKRGAQADTLESILSRSPRLQDAFEHIGLNTEDAPDLVMSYMPPQQVMELIKVYHNKKGSSLDVSLCTMMAVCGGIAVRTYLEEKISFSFGCDDSRRLADMRRDKLAVGIPRRMFDLFVD
ncbi:MAG: DUF169 domain-containing protein [Candidatus Omnitrophica bacterium]|nr:DUF169 domain-containing protein [Candidatus Omnitrophota bacterium]